jgi:hypothetical protein
MKNTSTITRTTWREFKKTKLLWLINSILQIFGWAILLQYDSDTNEICDVYPARIKHRKDSEESNIAEHENLMWYLQNNIQIFVDSFDKNI